MAEVEFNNEGLTRAEKYDVLTSQIPHLLDKKADWIANSANFCGALKESFGWLWVGVYRKISAEYMQLGPFQGPVACTFIQKEKGVCGTAWSENKIQLVPNVHEFPGHIACSARSNSEIVLPIHTSEGFWGVLDIDSENLNDFSESDAEQLKKLTSELSKFI